MRNHLLFKIMAIAFGCVCAISQIINSLRVFIEIPSGVLILIYIICVIIISIWLRQLSLHSKKTNWKLLDLTIQTVQGVVVVVYFLSEVVIWITGETFHGEKIPPQVFLVVISGILLEFTKSEKDNI